MCAVCAVCILFVEVLCVLCVYCVWRCARVSACVYVLCAVGQCSVSVCAHDAHTFTQTQTHLWEQERLAPPRGLELRVVEKVDHNPDNIRGLGVEVPLEMEVLDVYLSTKTGTKKD